jgi:chorismate mutase
MKTCKKLFQLTEEDQENLELIKNRNHITTDVAAVRYALQRTVENMEEKEKEQRMVENIVNLMLAKNSDFEHMIRSSVRETEKNTNMLLDAINTMLFQEKIDTCIPVGSVMSPVLSTSEEQFKDKIAHKKQRKDDKKSRYNI